MGTGHLTRHQGGRTILPALFVAHGSPLIAVEESDYARALAALPGQLARRPRAIVVFSAHYEHAVEQVGAAVEYRTLHDFAGFPPQLYELHYPAHGDPQLAQEIANRLHAAGVSCELDAVRGLDHGVWTILHRIYPAADIPVIPLSVNPELSPTQQYAVGQALSPLREQDVLFIGSGVIVHNFSAFRHATDDGSVLPWVEAFEEWVGERIEHGGLDDLLAYESRAPYAQLAVPRTGKEHFAPLFYALGAGWGERSATERNGGLLHRSYWFGVLSNSIYALS